MVESIRETGDKTEPETRFYITSLVMPGHKLGPVIRSHWAVGKHALGHGHGVPR